MLRAWVCSRARQAPQSPGLSPATCAGAAPPPGSCRPGQRLHSPALCASAPGGAAFRASPKPQPFPGPLLLQGTLLTPQQGRGCRHRGAGIAELPPPWRGDARVWHGRPSLHCRAAGSRGQGKCKVEPATHSTLTPAAWSGPQFLAYQVASASLLTPLRGVAFELETLDLQV